MRWAAAHRLHYTNRKVICRGGRGRCTLGRADVLEVQQQTIAALEQQLAAAARQRRALEATNRPRGVRWGGFKNNNNNNKQTEQAQYHKQADLQWVFVLECWTVDVEYVSNPPNT